MLKNNAGELPALLAVLVRLEFQVNDQIEFVINGLVAQIIEEAAPPGGANLREAPVLANLDGLGVFLQLLRNAGTQPYLAGHFPLDPQHYVTVQSRARDRRLSAV